MNEFLHEMKNETNYGYTENGAIKHNSTMNKVLDLFAMGAATRSRDDSDIIKLFRDAYNENKVYAIRCLFYIRDCREGQGERRFFRVVFNWLCKMHPEVAETLIGWIPEMGRWDDLLYATFDTPLEEKALTFYSLQLFVDSLSDNPTLAAMWAPSENASSVVTTSAAHKLRKRMGLSHKEYRQLLTKTRAKIGVLETKMTSGDWDSIDFSKIPAKAGMKYRDAFRTREETAERYKNFMESKTTKVNAKVLYPYEIAAKAWDIGRYTDVKDTQRLTLQKYWDNLPDLYEGHKENAIAVVDVSGSMTGTPMDVAVSLGAYIADKSTGPFAHHFITFSASPELVEFTGDDITEKMWNCRKYDWGMNTNIKKVFDLLLRTAKKSRCAAADMPKRLYILSDMEFDSAVRDYDNYWTGLNRDTVDTLLEEIKKKWAANGYDLPQLIFWNLNARTNNIPAIGDGISYVSGFSPNILRAVLTNKTGIDLMIETLDNPRYTQII